MKKQYEYLIIGSNNFWYSSGLKTLQEAKKYLKVIQKNELSFDDPESGEVKEDLPEIFYIYKSELIEEI